MMDANSVVQRRVLKRNVEAQALINHISPDFAQIIALVIEKQLFQQELPPFRWSAVCLGASIRKIGQRLLAIRCDILGQSVDNHIRFAVLVYR